MSRGRGRFAWITYVCGIFGFERIIDAAVFYGSGCFDLLLSSILFLLIKF